MNYPITILLLVSLSFLGCKEAIEPIEPVPSPRQLAWHEVVIEDISKGERVREFMLEGKTKDGWKTIFKGSCIGHKFIYYFDGMEVSSIRLNILKSKGEPEILDLSVFHVKNLSK